MKRTSSVALVGIVALIGFFGCSSDDSDGGMLMIDEVEVAENAINETLATVVDPLVGLVELLQDQLFSLDKGEIVCPDTSGVCNPGTLTCAVGPLGQTLEFDFSDCGVVVEQMSVSVDGGITVSTLPFTLLTTLSDLEIDGGPGLTGVINVSDNPGLNNCSVELDVIGEDGSLVVGDILGCGDNPSSDSSFAITVVTVQGVFVLNVDFDGSNMAAGSLLQDESPIATCMVNLDTLVADCTGV